MARPPLPLGLPGQIRVTEDRPKLWIARCRFRDHDGVTRQLKANGPTKTAATSALHTTIHDRQLGRGTSRAANLTPASTFADATVDYLAKIERKREDSTHALYVFHLEATILNRPGESGDRRVRMVAEVRSGYNSPWPAMNAVAQKLGVGTGETVRKWVRPAEIDGGVRGHDV